MPSLWMLLLALTGCGDKPDTGTELGCFDSPPEAEIGSGEGEWVSLSEGDPVTMVHGPQGGWHMLGSLWAANVEQIVEIEFTITVEETGAVVSDNKYRVALVPDGECAGYFPGMYGYLAVSDIAEGALDTPPELLSYQNLVMAMTVTDSAGRTASAERTVLAEPDPVDVVSSDSGSAQ
jgi:hypothetical protein